jgi:arthrofactin-type cyclic lipopeptide synthetase C
VAAAAEFYLDAIAAAQPSGPLHLLGHSFGGWVVFEMALRLAAAGREVASLTLIDSSVPEPAADTTHTDALMQLVEIFEQAAEQPLGLSAQQFDLLPEAAQRALLHERLVAAGVLPARSQPALLVGPVRTFASCMRAGYAPSGPYRGALQLVLLDDPRCDEAANRLAYQQRAEGWRRLAPAARSWRGPGNHMTALKAPHAQAVADWLRGHGAP